VNGNCYCEKVISQVRSSGSDDSSDNHNTSTVDNSSGSKSGSDSSNGSKSSSGGGANSSSGGGANNSSVSVVGRHFDATRPAAAATLLSSTLHPKRGNKGKTISMRAGGRVSMTGCFLNAERHLQPCRLPCCLKKRKNNQPVALVAVFLCTTKFCRCTSRHYQTSQRQKAAAAVEVTNNNMPTPRGNGSVLFFAWQNAPLQQPLVPQHDAIQMDANPANAMTDRGSHNNNMQHRNTNNKAVAGTSATLRHNVQHHGTMPPPTLPHDVQCCLPAMPPTPRKCAKQINQITHAVCTGATSAAFKC